MTTMIRKLGDRSFAYALFIATVLTAGCGGGGGGSDSPADGGGSPTEGLSGANGRSFLVEAVPVTDTCRKRTSTVRQVFTVGDGAIDTTLVKIPTAAIENGVEGSFAESNGSCTRQYTVKLINLDAPQGIAHLVSVSDCAGQRCETEWNGTAVEVAGKSADDVTFDGEFAVEKINGERCNPDVPFEVGYRPSLFECNGNAAVLLRGSQRRAYSVVVRRDGQFNDRDPQNPGCGTNACSPYKTQKEIELPDYSVQCLGASGFSDEFVPVKRISIKYVPQPTDATDVRQFEQYCLPDKRIDVH